MWKITERTAVKECKSTIRELQAVLSEANEDHLGVALIQPGGSRYEQMKWQMNFFLCLQKGWNRVYYVPCNRNIARDFSRIYANKQSQNDEKQLPCLHEKLRIRSYDEQRERETQMRFESAYLQELE